MEKVYELYLRTTPERLWTAITDREIRGRFQFGLQVESLWTVGSEVRYGPPGRPGAVVISGEVLEVDPPHRLVQSMTALWSEAVRAEPTSRVTMEIQAVSDDSCALTLTHDQLRDGANEQLYGGWPMILSGLKTWLETGEVLTTPGSLLYGPGSGVQSGR
jgi:uncharacterized protein YndB with AHSA1/START domain